VLLHVKNQIDLCKGSEHPPHDVQIVVAAYQMVGLTDELAQIDSKKKRLADAVFALA